jgi:hypothetical protein
VAGAQLDFYRARIEQARDEASTATLAHVRERCRRSEMAWLALATRAEKSEHLREAEARRKAAEQSNKNTESIEIEHEQQQTEYQPLPPNDI